MDIFPAVIIATLGNLGSAVVLGAYQSVRALLQRRFGAESKLLKAVEGLEQEPDSDGWKGVLQEAAKKAGVDKDAEIMKAVKELLDAVKAHNPAAAAGISMDIDLLNAEHLDVIAAIAAKEDGIGVKIGTAEIKGTASFNIGGGCPKR